MLDAFIIDQIKKREEDRERDRQRIQPRLDRQMPFIPPGWQPGAWERSGGWDRPADGGRTDDGDRRSPDLEDGRIVLDM